MSTKDKFIRLQECNKIWPLYQQKVWLPRSSKIDLAITMYLFALQGGTYFELGPHIGGTSVFLTRIAQSTGGRSILLDNFTQTDLPDLKINGSALLKNNLETLGCKNFTIIDKDIDSLDVLPAADFYFFDAWSANIDHLAELLATAPEHALFAIDDILFYGQPIDAAPTKNVWPTLIEKEVQAGKLFPIVITGMRGFFSKVPRSNLVKATQVFAAQNKWQITNVNYFAASTYQVLLSGAHGVNHCLQCQTEIDGLQLVKFA